MHTPQRTSNPIAAPLTLIAALLLLAMGATPAHAQYFGQNKVQYEDFDWKVIPTENLDVHFYAQTMDASREMARAAERWHWRLSEVFSHRLSERKPVVMYANHPDFQQTNIIQGEIGIGTGGVTDAARNRATQPFTGDFASTSHVVGHELAHVFQYDIANGTTGIRAMGALPLWLIEGMAEYLSVGSIDPHTAMWLRDAVLRGDVPSIQDLSSGRYFPYRYGQALMAYIGGTWGDQAVTRLYRVALEHGLTQAIQEVTGLSHGALSEAWARDLRATYLPLVLDREAPEMVGRPLFERTERPGEMNLAPVLSPDGSMIAFISERDVFSINLYIANVETGEIVTRLTSSERQPHFDALNFLETAGAWSPDGRLFIYTVVDDGDNEFRIAEVGGDRVVRSIEVPGVTAMTDPAWSPDGRRIAFAGSAGGINDLYVYDLETEEATQLTDDLHAEMQPSWSPDGRHLVFSTDRGPGTEFANLDFGPLRLATMEVATGQIELLPSFLGAKHIDPHYAPGGESVYFISDRDGVSDIFRLDLASLRAYQVTRTATGISGITGYSPALTVAANTGRLAFSIFQDNRYTLHALEPGEAAGEPVTGPGDVRPAGALPPVVAGTGIAQSVVAAYLNAPQRGLPPEGAYEVEDYRPSLGLEYIGPPMIGASVDQFGTNIGGAVSFAFRDLLGNRTLGVQAQGQGDIQDLGGQLSYENRENRINWGVIAGRIPYRSGRRFVDPTDDGSALVVRNRIFRTYLNQLGGRVAYPFSRAHRVEATGAYSLYTFDAEDQVFLCNLAGQNCDQIREESLDLDTDPVSVASTAAAFVGDWAAFAFTGPVLGARYRFEVAPTFGDLQYTSALADYRRYFFFRPTTVAVRGLHYGRYGRDAERNDFMSPLFLGYTGMVRGYTMNSFTLSECSGANGGTGCPEFDRLVGSRIALTSVEMRVPLFGTEDFGLVNLPFLPTTVGAFFDAGAAWTADESPTLEFSTTSTERVPVASAGAFARFNILGYMVAGVWVAHPFQRPQKDWVLGFEIAPGW